MTKKNSKKELKKFKEQMGISDIRHNERRQIMDGIIKYDGSVCKEGYYRFQTRNWFNLDRMRATANMY